MSERQSVQLDLEGDSSLHHTGLDGFMAPPASVGERLSRESDNDIMTRLAGALEECRAGLSSVLEIPAGRHHIYPDFLPEKQCYITNHDSGLKRILFDLEGLSGITIEGNGAELIFHGRALPFYLKNSNDITIRNFKMDWDRPFLSQAEIVGVGDGFLDLRFSDECPVTVQENGIVFTGDHFSYNDIDNLLEYDCTTKFPAQGAQDNFGFRGWHRAENLGDGLIRLFSSYHPENRFKAGNFVVIKNEQRWSPGITMICCRNIQLSRIDIYHAGGMGIVGQNCRDVLVDFVRVMRRPASGRCFSVFIDALHFVDCHGTLRVINCLLESQMDDAINIHGIFMRAAGEMQGKVVAFRRMHHQQFGVQTLFEGDLVEFFDDRTLACVGSARVTNVQSVNCEILQVTFDHIPQNISWERLLVMRADHDFDVKISNCIMRGNRSRGILFNAYGRCRIEQCIFQTPWQAVRISGDVDGKWYESGPSEDIEITDCIFDRCGYAIGHPVIELTADRESCGNKVAYHRKVSIHGNRFILEHSNLAEVDDVEQFEFFDNRIESAVGVIKKGAFCSMGRMQNIKVMM